MLTKLEEIEKNLKKHYTVFIASSSYENRCLTFTHAIENKISFDYKLVSISVPHKELIDDNLKVFKSADFKVFEINGRDQIFSVRNIFIELDKILTAKPDASFLIDATTFTRQTLLILARLLRNILTKANTVQFIYTAAKEYSIGLTDERKWLSKGVLEVNSVFGYSGLIKPSRPYHLIILMGYEVERAVSLINAYEPTKITIGCAGEAHSVSKKHYALNKKKYDELLVEFPYAEHFEFTSDDVIACSKEIIAESRKYPDYNVIISSMNNKMSTLACAIAAFENEAIQLASAIPAVYNYENYSIPDDKCYVIEIPGFIKVMK